MKKKRKYDSQWHFGKFQKKIKEAETLGFQPLHHAAAPFKQL